MKLNSNKRLLSLVAVLLIVLSASTVALVAVSYGDTQEQAGQAASAEKPEAASPRFRGPVPFGPALLQDRAD